MNLSKYSLIPILLCIGLAGCKSTAVITPDQNEAKYSVIYLIHGDADYVFYDENGKAIRADENVLKQAQSISEELSNGEVFIFHQRPERKWLWMFPKKDRRMWYYRNGKLVVSQKYSPYQDGLSFTAEKELFRIHAHSSSPVPRYLFYFGHQIPREGGQRYDRSRSSVEVNAVTVTEGFHSFLPDPSAKFELIVLSSCNNGTPTMVKRLEPLTEVLLASPQNLHLSHIDTKAIGMLDNENTAKATEIAALMAQDTFVRLSATIQTEISLTLYDLGMLNPKNEPTYKAYQNYLSNTEQTISNDNVDCTGLSFFSNFDSVSGVQTWYRPARFGRRASVHSYSGWGCELPKLIGLN